MHRPTTRHPLALAIGGALTAMLTTAPVFAQQLIVEDGSTQTATGIYNGDLDNALRARNPGSTINGTAVNATSRGRVLDPANYAVLADLQGRIVLTDSFITADGFNTRNAGATNGGRIELNNVAINMSASSGQATYAASGGQAAMQGGSVLLTNTGTVAFATGAGSAIRLRDVNIDGTGGLGGYALGGASVAIEGGTMDLDGAAVLQAIGAGSVAEIVGTQITLNSTGLGAVLNTAGANAVLAQDGGSARLGPGTTLQVRDDNSGLLVAKGAGSVIEVNGARVVGLPVREFGYGALATDGAEIRFGGGSFLQSLGTNIFGSAAAQARGAGSLIATGDTTIIGSENGLEAEDGGTLRLGQGTVVRAEGTGVQTSGTGSRATIEGTTIEISGGTPVLATGVSVLRDTEVVVRGSSIISNGGGITLGNNVGVFQGPFLPPGRVTLEDSAVRAGVIGVLAFKGTSLTSRNSSIEGGEVGIFSGNNSFDPGPTVLDLSGGSVTGVTGPAISIEQASTLTLSNGIKLKGGANEIIRALNAADVSVDATALEGIIRGTGAALNLGFANQSSLTGSIIDERETTGPDNSWRVTVDGTSAWNITGNSALTSLTSAGRVAFAAPMADAFQTLTVKGDYVGNNGTLVFNTRLGDSASLTDKLIVGGNTSGTTNVEVVNAGGGGAATTVDGIELIDVAGQSNGVFNQSGRIVAGAYDYFLKKGGVTDPNDGDWYLRSELTPPPTPPPTTPPPTTPPPTTPPPTTPPPTTPPPVEPPPVTPPPTTPGDAILRPEVGAYLGNQATAASMFNYSLQDRIGSSAAARDGERGGGAWVRVSRGTVGGEVDPGQVELDADVTRLMLGVQVAAVDLGGGSLELGVIGAQGHSTSSSQSDVTGYQAKGSVQGWSAGGYATWVSGGDGPGAYVDTWLQRGNYTLKVLGEGIGEERYDADTTTGSIEAGYAFAIGDALHVEPQLQAIYTDYKSDTHREANGTRVAASDVDGITTRLGVRVYGVSDAMVKPYAAVNWWHGPDDTEVAFDGTGIKLDLPRDRYEFRVGALVQLGDRWSGWTDVALQRSADDYSDARLQVGLNYSW